MKKKLYFFLIVVILLISMTIPAQAQDETPPSHPKAEQIFPLRRVPVPTWSEDEKSRAETNGQALPSGVSENEEVTAQMITGTSGLSYRYVKTFGTSEEPYLGDTTHLNSPGGLFIDGSDAIYVAEDSVGSRVLKFNASGVHQLTLGEIGKDWAHDDYISRPRDVVVEAGTGDIWVSSWSFIKEFDLAGNLLQSIPVDNPWQGGDDDYHFRNADGLAFDSSGYLYISDSDNHRIQIYDVSDVGSNPSAVYAATIGTTGIPQTDNSGFNYPGEIALDSTDRVYVVDRDNGRIQRCTDGGSWSFSCATFYSDPDFWWSEGITIKSDVIYLSDSDNNQILECDTGGTCNVFADGATDGPFRYLTDLAVDSSGDVYVSDMDNHRVAKCDSDGNCQTILGVMKTPYLTNSVHINDPRGVVIASDGGIIFSEGNGKRLVKLNAAGTQQFAIGEPGFGGNDNYHFWDIDGTPAVDAAGKIYVPDTHNHRIQMYTSTGAYSGTFGERGYGNTRFRQPSGVAINPTTGYIYVADRNNQRVQVYDSTWWYIATVGETNVPGSDNAHFERPQGVAVTSDGTIFVSDTGNYRVQKCTLGGGTFSCSTFVGETGVIDEAYEHLEPYGITVDSSGRVFVADGWNNRIQVYDSTGAYLTTIGGDWSSLSGGMRWPVGVALDSAGNVYVADSSNYRIQKFSPGVPDWTQSNVNGFGDRYAWILSSLQPFDSMLYASISRDSGAQLWRSSDGQNWGSITLDGFGNSANFTIDHLFEFNGNLYAGTSADETNGGEVWRSDTGNDGDWEQVVSGGFVDTSNAEVFRFATFNNKLYASTWNWSGAQGGEVWRSDTGNLGEWDQVVSDGFSDSANGVVLTFETYNGSLYASTANMDTGAQVWRSSSGDVSSWVKVNSDGFGNDQNINIYLQAFNGYLYALTRRSMMEGGSQLWRCKTCDGTDWLLVKNGFGSSENGSTAAIEVFGNLMYIALSNADTGVEVWRTGNGSTWQQVGFSGFGSSVNSYVSHDNAFTVFNSKLFLGVFSRFRSGAGQIWRYDGLNQMPIVMQTATFSSQGKYDGWVLESTETSKKGGSMNSRSKVFYVGDDALNRQYRGILSFDTSGLPPTAVITKVTLKVKNAGLVGTNPFKSHKGLRVDIRNPYFGNKATLQTSDFQAKASKNLAGKFSSKAVSRWYSADLSAASIYVNKTGTTQFRLRFYRDDNNDGGADYFKFYSGNAPAASRPQLIVEYYVP